MYFYISPLQEKKFGSTTAYKQRGEMDMKVIKEDYVHMISYENLSKSILESIEYEIDDFILYYDSNRF